MIAIAAAHPDRLNIDYRVVDATDREALLGLGTAVFDGALCNMALMDMAEIEPLMTALAVLLKPGGRFVFSALHPCFNNPATVQMGELEDRNGTIVTTYSAKIARYKTPFTQVGLAMQGQPVPHPYFHRPLSLLPAWCGTASRSKPSLPTTLVARHHCRGMAASVRFQRRLLFGYGAPPEFLFGLF